MRIVAAGASGVIGRATVPLLLARGHHVVGLCRSEAGAARVRALGAEAVAVDALDAAALAAAVAAARPDAVAHLLTALDPAAKLRDFDADFAATNRLRTTGTDNLLAAAGAAKIVAQSFCGWPYARTGGPAKTETDPLDPSPFPAQAQSLAAIRHLEAAVTAAGGTVLRYGSLYGPGTAIAPDGAIVRALHRRSLPVFGRGEGVWSFLHVDDAASATVAALEGAARGIFNVCDDEPAPVRDWLPLLARAQKTRRQPLHLPVWLLRLVVPPHLVALMTDARGGSNARFCKDFGWRPRWPSWRAGFYEAL